MRLGETVEVSGVAVASGHRARIDLDITWADESLLGASSAIE